jgi:hypothetical protein
MHILFDYRNSAPRKEIIMDNLFMEKVRAIGIDLKDQEFCHFIGSWMVGAHIEIHDGKIMIVKPGEQKFIDKVDEITFSGPEALKHGKKVYYCTNVGVLNLRNAVWR